MSALLIAGALGHPLGARAFDRAIQVVVSTDGVRIEYELGVSELTIATELQTLTSDGKLPVDSVKMIERYRDVVLPIVEHGLILTIDGKELKLKRLPSAFERTDHVRYRFIFKAAQAAGPEPSSLSLLDTNFEGEIGYQRLALKAEGNVGLLESTAPTLVTAMPLIANWEMTPQQEEASRSVRASYRRKASAAPAKPAVTINDARTAAVGATALRQPTTVPTTSQSEQQPPPSAAQRDDQDLRRLLADPNRGFLRQSVLFLIAFVLGMAHAIKPGHGKTLVAAYLVGQQGTVYHAVVLGLVTTLTHTGSVLLVALLLQPFAGRMDPGKLSFWLSLASGVLIVGLGSMLLWRRATGGDDLLHVHGAGGHVHLPDGSVQWLDAGKNTEHSHDHAQAHSHGDEHHHPFGGPAHTHHGAASGGIKTGGLLALGFSGGLVPCDDAVLLLVAAIGAGMLAQAVGLLLAFSAGLATVLVLLGVLVVKVQGFASRGNGPGPWAARLQIASSTLIIAIGLALCWKAFRS